MKSYSFVYDEADNVVWKNDTRYVYDELNQVVEEIREEDLQSLLYSGGVGLVYGDLFGSLPLESYHSGTELIELQLQRGEHRGGPGPGGGGVEDRATAAKPGAPGGLAQPGAIRQRR